MKSKGSYSDNISDFHIAIIKSGDLYTEFRREKDEFGKGINVFYGIDGDNEEVQTIMFDRRIFSVNEAEKWLEQHKYKYIEFEKAEGEKTMSVYQIKANGNPELSAKVENDTGYIEGYAAIFDIVDFDNDIIRKGSFKRSIDNQISAGKVLLMSRHYAHGGDTGEAIGKIVEAKEDEKGFWIKAQLFKSQHAQDIREKVIEAPGAFGMSVGWKNVEGGVKKRDGEETGFEFTEMNLKEVTLTLNPAQGDTIGTVGAKAEEHDQRLRAIEKRIYCLEEMFAKSVIDDEENVVYSEASRAAKNRRFLNLLENEE